MTLEEVSVLITDINAVDELTMLTGQIIMHKGFSKRDDQKYYQRIYNARLVEDNMIVDVETYCVKFGINEFGRYRILKSIDRLLLNDIEYSAVKEEMRMMHDYNKYHYSKFKHLKENYEKIETLINAI